VVHRNLGNYNAARTNYKKTLEMERHIDCESAKNTDVASTLYNLGGLHYELGNVQKASDYCKEATDMLTACLGDDASTNEIFTRCLAITETLEKER
jgi:tetratricopeptide (TPR) repeat protein